MLYFDTSFLAPLILEEATSAAIEHFFSQMRGHSLAVSEWTRVEFSSLLAKEVRMGFMTSEVAIRADSQFETIVRESFRVLLPRVEDFNLAKIFLGEHRSGLRAGDALHLAIAKNQGAEAIHSLDKTMLKAGEALGLPMRMGLSSGR